MQQPPELDLRIVLRRWQQNLRLILAVGAVVGIVGAVVALREPRIWRATAVLILPPDLAEGQSPIMLAEARPTTILRGLLQSRPTMQSVAEVGKKSMRDLEEIYRVGIEDETSQVQVHVDHPNREMGLRMVDAALRSTEQIRTQLRSSSADRLVQQMRSVVDERRQQVETAEDALVQFQKKAKTPLDPERPFPTEYATRLRTAKFNLSQIETQVKALKGSAERRFDVATDLPLSDPSAARNGTTWRDRLVQLEYDLRVAQIVQGDASPEVQRLREQIKITKEQATDEARRYLETVNRGLDPKIAELEIERITLRSEIDYLQELLRTAPTEQVVLRRLARTVRLREDEYRAILVQFAEAQIKQQVGNLEWTVLAPAFIEDEPINTGPLRAGATWFVAGGIIAVLFFEVRLALRKRRRPAGD